MSLHNEDGIAPDSGVTGPKSRQDEHDQPDLDLKPHEQSYADADDVDDEND